jgi:hypothetical protein
MAEEEEEEEESRFFSLSTAALALFTPLNPSLAPFLLLLLVLADRVPRFADWVGTLWWCHFFGFKWANWPTAAAAFAVRG